MYRKLIGPYPYDKFALVENFWDTGYGMPSFTLLGPTIIRFPFILHSSYPHEILHNWWGNSVFVDYETGNWCEGLTAYLADHLIKEGQGRGRLPPRHPQALPQLRPRRGGLPAGPSSARATRLGNRGGRLRQVADALAHAAQAARATSDSSTGLRRFYRANRFSARRSTIWQAFRQPRGRGARRASFAQWVDRTGAPQLSPRRGHHRFSATARAPCCRSSSARCRAAIRTTLNAFRSRSPSTARRRGRTGHARGPRTARRFASSCPPTPRRVDVDPQFDLFRRLDPYEIPASVGQLFGAEQVMIVLPTDAARRPRRLGGPSRRAGRRRGAGRP